MRNPISGLLSVDGMYMKEIDRVLRPGGYWVLSGPPINWRTDYKSWKRFDEELEEEQRKIEVIANLLCWEKKHEKDEIAIWRKRENYEQCPNQEPHPTMCETTESDSVWYATVDYYLLSYL